MKAEQAQEISERDQLWASLRALRPEIDLLATTPVELPPRQQQVVTLLARIVLAELDFRERAITPE